VIIFVPNESTRGCAIFRAGDRIRCLLIPGVSPTDVHMAFECMYSARELWAPKQRITLGTLAHVITVPLTYYAELSYALLDTYINDTTSSRHGNEWTVPPNRTIGLHLLPANKTKDVSAASAMVQLLRLAWPDPSTTSYIPLWPLFDADITTLQVPVWLTRNHALSFEFMREGSTIGFKHSQCKIFDNPWSGFGYAGPQQLALTPAEQYQLAPLLPQRNDAMTPILSPWSFHSPVTPIRVVPFEMYDNAELTILLTRSTIERYKLVLGDPFDPLTMLWEHIFSPKSGCAATCNPSVNIMCAAGRATASGLTAIHLLLPSPALLNKYFKQWLGIDTVPFDEAKHITAVTNGTLKLFGANSAMTCFCDACQSRDPTNQTAAVIHGVRYHCTLCLEPIDLCPSCYYRVPPFTNDTHLASHASALQKIEPPHELSVVNIVTSIDKHHEALGLVRQTLLAFDDNGFTALHSAAFGYPWTLHFLMEWATTFPDLINLDMLTHDHGLSLLACAARGLQGHSIMFLVSDERTKAQVLQRSGIDGALPIHHLLQSMCINRGALNIYQDLDDNGGVYGITYILRDGKGNALPPRVSMLYPLISHDTVNAVTNNGESVLHLAARLGDAALLPTLIQYGVKPPIFNPSLSLSSSSSSSSSAIVPVWELAMAHGDITMCNYFLQYIMKSSVVTSLPMAQQFILRAREMAKQITESLPHRLPPLYCINENELGDRQPIGDPYGLGDSSLVSKAKWRGHDVIIKSVLFSDDEHDALQRTTKAAATTKKKDNTTMLMNDDERKAMRSSARNDAAPEFVREIMYYMVLSSLFPGTVPLIHGIIQVIIYM
jgi:hypothetical protein